MGDPDREESSGDDIESEPDSDRSDGADEGSREDEREDEGSREDEEKNEDGGEEDEDDGEEHEDDGESEENGGGDEKEEDDGEDVINEGTSPRTRRRRLRPPREKEEKDDDGDGVDDGGTTDAADEEREDDDVGEEEDGDGEEEDGKKEDGDGGDDESEEDEAVSNGSGAAVSRRDDGPLFEGPESDEEMPLADHIEEMMRRLAVVFLVAGIATLIAYPSADVAINYFWSSHIPDPGVNRPRIYGPLEYLLTKLKVAGIAGVIFGLPVFIYETYLFMRPGLYPRERRYYLAAIPTSVVLAAIGSLFAHFIVLPAVFAYFTAYTEGTAVIAFGLQETFNLIVVLIAYMAVVFQIPLLIMLAIMMNLVTRQWLEDKRLLFWGGFLGLSWLVTPDPTGMAPIIVTLTMIGLYEGTLALLRWTGN